MSTAEITQEGEELAKNEKTTSRGVASKAAKDPQEFQKQSSHEERRKVRTHTGTESETQYKHRGKGRGR